MLYLVRHAKPASAYGDSVDPGLDDTGRTQAVLTAERLKALPNRLPVYTSPLRRCRETAQPLAEAWGIQAIVLPDVGEVPSPPLSLKERQEWLRKAMTSDWANLQASAPAGSPDYAGWRSSLVDAVSVIAGDAVIYSHFIAINAIIGAALQSEQVISFRPGHASVTTIEVSGGKITVKQLGEETAPGDTNIVLGN